MQTPRGVFGDASWPLRPAADAAAIVRTAERYCPELPFVPREDAVFEADCRLYPDYRLICLREPVPDLPVPDPPVPDPFPAALYGFYAPGDFRPLDPFGSNITHLNAVGPLQLTNDSVVEYVLLRLCAEMPVMDAATRLVTLGLDAAAARRLLLEFGVAPVRRLLPTPRTPKDAALPTGEAGWRDALRASTASVTAGTEKEEPRLWPIVVRGASDLPLLPDPPAPPDIVALAVAPAAIPPGAAPPAAGHRVTVSVLLPAASGMAGIRQVTVGVSTDGTDFTFLETHARLLKTDAARAAALTAAAPLVRRTDTAMIDVTWRRLNPEDDGVWRHTLRIFDFDRSQAVFRFGALAFYRHFQLMEVLVPHGAGYRRSYALVAPERGDMRVVPLTGKSAVLHQVNAEPGELVIDRHTADSYLRFFCWAVQGTGGPFYIPLTLREIPLNKMPADAQAAILRQLQFGIVDVGDEEAARLGYGASEMHFRRKATIAYDSAVFEAAFAVQPAGMIDMINDNPRVADLDLRKEEYGGDAMFVLRDFVKLGGPRPPLRHYTRPESEPPAPVTPPAAVTVSSIEALLGAIGKTGEVAGLDVNAPIVFDAGAFSKPA